MIPAEILQKVRHIEIRTKGLVNDLFGGEYHSVFKGRGMTFSEVREYQPGDDIRLIDWNVTARYNSPYVKIFEEERELTVFLLVDLSRSGHFGSVEKYKAELATEIAAVMGFAAIRNNDKVGLILFTDEVEHYVAPKKGHTHVLRVIRELLYHRPQGRGTSLSQALDFLLKVARRRSVVFLISDFIADGFWPVLKIANRKHDLIGLQIYDPVELRLPDLGLLKVHDPETGQQFWMDTGSAARRARYQQHLETHFRKFKQQCQRINFDLVQLSTAQDYIEPLMHYFRQRERRY